MLWLRETFPANSVINARPVHFGEITHVNSAEVVIGHDPKEQQVSVLTGCLIEFVETRLGLHARSDTSPIQRIELGQAKSRRRPPPLVGVGRFELRASCSQI